MIIGSSADSVRFADIECLFEGIAVGVGALVGMLLAVFIVLGLGYRRSVN